MDVYSERSHLLALLASDKTAYVYDDPEGEEGFKTVVAIRLNGRFLCWHIADADTYLFTGVHRIKDGLWDGHTTEEKYEDIREYVGVA